MVPDLELYDIEKLKNERDIKRLINILEIPNEKIQDKAAIALSSLGKIVVMPTIDALKSPNKDVQGYAAAILGNVGDVRAVEILINVLSIPYDYNIDNHPNDPEWDVQIIAAISLGDIGDNRAIEPLTKALDDPNINLRNIASKVLVNNFSLNAQEKRKQEQDMDDKKLRQSRKIFQVNTYSLDDLEKLSEFKDKGIITEIEFQIKKKQILDL
jgi:HEAT repeat protein